MLRAGNGPRYKDPFDSLADDALDCLQKGFCEFSPTKKPDVGHSIHNEFYGHESPEEE